jgi:hypothetical protein
MSRALPVLCENVAEVGSPDVRGIDATAAGRNHQFREEIWPI